MRVLLVHSRPLDLLGGAELSLSQHLESAPSGVQVEVILPNDSVDVCRYDTIILGNIRPSGGLGEKAEYRWAKLWAKRLRGYQGYVVKSERDVHPCTHRDGRCVDVESELRWSCDCTGAKIRQSFEELYNICDAIQFLSPLHRQVINSIIRIDKPRQYIVASPIDFENFRVITPFPQRKQKALVTGDAVRVASTTVQRAEAQGFEIEKLDYLSVPYDQMPDILNRYQAVVIDPVMIHAFGRLAVEGLACGCQVIASPRVGAMSWADPVQASREANNRFWAMVLDRPDQPNSSRLKRLPFF